LVFSSRRDSQKRKAVAAVVWEAEQQAAALAVAGRREWVRVCDGYKGFPSRRERWQQQLCGQQSSKLHKQQ
jgi:hypothetical protein